MAQIKELLYSLTASYNKRVEKAKKQAENIIKTAGAAKAAGREVQSAKAQQSPKK